MDNAELARAYLGAMTQGVPAHLYSYLWSVTPPGQQHASKTSAFPGGASLDSMVNEALRHSHNRNVYYGMGLSATRLAAGKRLNTKTLKPGEAPRPAAGITAVWADFDFGTEGHSSDHIPADEDEALDALAPVLDEIPASMIVNSGGGLHLYWLLNAPMLVSEDDATLEDIRNLADRWINYLQRAAQRAGFALDAVRDLERVLRVPGTYNHKHEPPRLVEFTTYEPGIRYDPHVLWDRCKEYTMGVVRRNGEQVERRAVARTTPAQVDDLIIDPARAMPFHKWEALNANNLQFRRTWNHQRTDLDNNGATNSEYEFALIHYGLRAEWTAQEIVDMVVAWRVKHNLDPLQRNSYWFNRSINEARTLIAADQDDGQAPPPPAPPGDFPPGDGAEDEGAPRGRDEALANLARAFGLTRAGVELRRIVRVDGKDSTYYLETSQGRVEMGKAINMVSIEPCRQSLYRAGFNLMATRQNWTRVLDWQLAVTEIETISEVSKIGLAMSLLREYLSKMIIVESVHEVEDDARAPFKHQGGIAFFLRSFVEWAALNAPNERLSSDEAATALHAAGIKQISPKIKDERGKRTTRSAWLMMPEPDEPDEENTTPEREAIAHVA